jgi:hypothetical protein
VSSMPLVSRGAASSAGSGGFTSTTAAARVAGPLPGGALDGGLDPNLRADGTGVVLSACSGEGVCLKGTSSILGLCIGWISLRKASLDCIPERARDPFAPKVLRARATSAPPRRPSERPITSSRDRFGVTGESGNRAPAASRAVGSATGGGLEGTIALASAAARTSVCHFCFNSLGCGLLAGRDCRESASRRV